MDGIGASDLVQVWSTCGQQLLSKFKAASAAPPSSASACVELIIDIIKRLSSEPTASSTASAAAADALKQLLASATASPAALLYACSACASIIRCAVAAAL